MGLFNTTVHHHERNDYTKEVVKTVHEHKAPTDESVRLLNEFEDKARKNIIKELQIQENYLSAIVVLYQSDDIFNQCIYHIRFILNGKEYFFEVPIKRREFTNETSGFYDNDAFDSIVRKFLMKKFSDIIAVEIIKEHPTNPFTSK